KGYVVMAVNDSVADLAKQFLAENNFVGDQVVLELNNRFGSEINVSRVIAAKGENDIIDYIAFDGEKPESKSKWKVWFGNQGKIIDTPEEALDMRTDVTADYSQYLEQEWVKALRKKYKVKVNKKVLKSLEGK
ncbi:MAG: hypothetical protein J1E63_03095, partial [Muribaculaceae bacterium]|nr:hypothetical protein [Muribaculaceae bacterium]